MSAAARPLRPFEIEPARLSEIAASREAIDPESERNQVISEIRATFPDQALAHGIDAKGCYARIGDVEARARDVTTALRSALAKARA